MRFAFQHSKDDPLLFVELGGNGIELMLGDETKRIVPYGDIATVRLSVAPEHDEVPARCVCTLTLRSGETLSFDSIAYEVATNDFKSTAYRPFVEALHEKLLTSNHRVQYMAGAKTKGVLQLVLLTIVTLFVVAGSVVFVIDKPEWMILSAVVADASLLWAVIGVLRRDWPRRYEPRAIPQALMPEPS